MRAKKLSEEVLVADEPVPTVSDADVARLIAESRPTRRRRIRFCAHPDAQDALHEMFIVHERGAYVRPHRHRGKPESMHIIRGEADMVFFAEDGTPVESVRLGPPGSGRPFYLRNSDSRWHTLLIRSEILVFHETTTGPFRREDTEFPRWAPEESDAAGVAAFMRSLAAAAGKARAS